MIDLKAIFESDVCPLCKKAWAKRKPGRPSKWAFEKTCNECQLTLQLMKFENGGGEYRDAVKACGDTSIQWWKQYGGKNPHKLLCRTEKPLYMYLMDPMPSLDITPERLAKLIKWAGILG